eukprot:4949227-Amphidinium_carterae.1
MVSSPLVLWRVMHARRPIYLQAPLGEASLPRFFSVAGQTLALRTTTNSEDLSPMQRQNGQLASVTPAKAGSSTDFRDALEVSPCMPHIEETWGAGIAGPAFKGGGAPAKKEADYPAMMSVGQQLQRLRQVESRFTTAQLKGLLAASPKLKALLHKSASGPALAAQIQHDVRRLAITPQLGTQQENN